MIEEVILTYSPLGKDLETNNWISRKKTSRYYCESIRLKIYLIKEYLRNLLKEDLVK